MELPITLTTTPKIKPDQTKLGFGRIFTDHMFIMNYDKGKGWHSARIVPYAPFSLDPSASVLHYSQTVFEGLKAYKTASGGVSLFRPKDNFKRLNESCDRLAIPRFDEEFALEATKKLVKIDESWIPTAEGTSLYIRPTIIAVDEFLGVHAAEKYIFYIILSPSGAYYPEGIAPVKIYVEDSYVRAVRGGMGFSKTGGNYAASILAGEVAKDKGFTQVLWLDGVERKYIEEVGAMNIFFKVNGEVITPELNGSILRGITRDSAIRVARDLGYVVTERRIAIDELFALAKDGKVEEAFGTGTAAVISPVGSLTYKGETVKFAGFETGPLAAKLYDEITGVQFGKKPDKYGWIETV